MFVGGSEKSIAGAFRQAKDLGAVLMKDEAEALLFDRSVAVRGWEVSQVNEMLTWMESHPLPFVCTTNLPERMDHAVPRRFTLKLHFDPLDAAGSALAFRRLLNAEPPRLLPDGLTPGDFAVVRKKAALFDEHDPAVPPRLAARGGGCQIRQARRHRVPRKPASARAGRRDSCAAVPARCLRREKPR